MSRACHNARAMMRAPASIAIPIERRRQVMSF
jgi:hypothetical protein